MISLVSNEEKFSEILQELYETYHKKNHDYGDSFKKSLKEFGLIASVVRMSDKMEMVKQLVKVKDSMVDESIRDTLMGLANYAIMTVMEL